MSFFNTNIVLQSIFKKRPKQYRNPDAYMDVGGRKRMEHVFDKTDGITDLFKSSDLTCMDALMARGHDVQERPVPFYFTQIIKY